MIKVIRGNPTPEELAAALAVVQARAAGPSHAGRDTGAVAEWADPARTLPRRLLPHPGPKAWRTTYWPA